MARERLVWDRESRRFVPAGEFYARRAAPQRSDLPAPMVIGDIAPYRSMATGEMIAGRKQHRDHLRAHGLEEVGNEKFPERRARPLPPVAPDVKQAIERHRAGHKPRPVERAALKNTRMYG